ncbi:MAG: hypothetical protein HZB61_03135 [Nitrospirae bacterium]|nr:hypothetical protein [Nitrospirota bacterium]
MSLILRIDVDKSYGRATFMQKVVSKISECYWFPAITSLGYLHDLKKFLLFLSEEKISAHIYFRKSTLPPREWLNNGLLKPHKLGLHAEDTRSFETFKKELEEVQSHFDTWKLSSFTKHGSGKWKSGRSHYPPYEPYKYLRWGKALGISFLFGNHEDISESHKLYGRYKFYPGAFWIDRPATDIKRVIDIAGKTNLVVLIHPADFLAVKQVEEGMRQLVTAARQQNVSWTTL